MLRLIRAHGALLQLVAEYSAAMCGVCPGTLVTWLWLCLSMIYCCALRPWSQICVMCQSSWVRSPCVVDLLCRGKLPRARGMAAYVRDGYEAFRQPKFECGCCEMLVVRVCGLRQNFYVYSLYRNPDQDDRI